MRKKDLTAGIAAANPFDSERLAGFSLGGAEDELLSEILAERLPASPQANAVSGAGRQGPPCPARDRRGGSWASAWSPSSWSPAPGGIRRCSPAPPMPPKSPTTPTPRRESWSALRGWHIEGLQAGDREGEMQFVHGDAPMPEETVIRDRRQGLRRLPAATRQREVELTWVPASLASFASRVRDRAYGAQVATTAPVLDTTARVFQYPGSKPGDLDVTALWREGGLVVEYRAPVPTMATIQGTAGLA